jgi:hypothetical protein
MKEHRGTSMDEALERSLTDLGPAAAALKKIPAAEAGQVGSWLVDIAKAIAASAKTTTPAEQGAIDRIAALFGVTG